MCLSILKALGGKGAVVVDIDERKRRAALGSGALAAVDGRDPEALGLIARAAQRPVRGVIDLVGSSESTALGFDVLSKGGKLVIVGLFGGGAWALPLIPIKAATIQGSYVGNLQELRELIELARTGAIPGTQLRIANSIRRVPHSTICEKAALRVGPFLRPKRPNSSEGRAVEKYAVRCAEPADLRVHLRAHLAAPASLSERRQPFAAGVEGPWRVAATGYDENNARDRSHQRRRRRACHARALSVSLPHGRPARVTQSRSLIRDS